MESLNETSWDVVISGTGLQQSLLALALSRSDKKVLHVDVNEYYGGPEAAFSLQEVDEWVEKVAGETSTFPFSSASIWKNLSESSPESPSKLAFSRAYTLSLSPQIIYSRSKLLTQLVSSKVYKQLEFQAVGNWWIYQAGEDGDQSSLCNLKRLPNGREDITFDRSIDVRAKRNLMKFLKFVVDYDAQPELWEPYADFPLSDYLLTQFQLPSVMQRLLATLTMSLDLPTRTTVKYSLPRIARHLTSIGVFGPGFGAVIPKWGGGSEIAQVACRSGAVGGGVYVLGTGIASINNKGPNSVEVELTNSEMVSTKLVVQSRIEEAAVLSRISRSVSIISGDLAPLFATNVEGAPAGAVSIVAFPSGTLSVENVVQQLPVFVMIHSSEAGECPQGQCVLYATTISDDSANARLRSAVSSILSTVPSMVTDSETEIVFEELYRLYYEQHTSSEPSSEQVDSNIYHVRPTSMDLAFDDAILDDVESAWKMVIGTMCQGAAESRGFMVFEERNGMADDDQESL